MRKFFVLSIALFILPILLNTQEPQHPQLTGIWKSNIGLVYEITQEGNHAFWKVQGKEEAGEIVIETDPNEGKIFLQATWQGEQGRGSATGRVIERDHRGRPMAIEWSNGVIFNREDREELERVAHRHDEAPLEIKPGEAWHRLKTNTKLKEIYISPLEEYGSIGVHMLDIRTLLQNTGVIEPVTIELVDQEGTLLANLGNYKPRITKDLRQSRRHRKNPPFDLISFDSIPEVKRVQGLRIESKTINRRPPEEIQRRKIDIRLLKLPQQCKLVFKDVRGRFQSILDVMVNVPVYKGYPFHQTWTFKGHFYDSNFNIQFTYNFTFKGYKISGDVYQYFGSTYSVGKYTIGKNTFEFTVSYFDGLEGADLYEVYKGAVINEKNMEGSVSRSWSNSKKTSGKWIATKIKDHK